MHNNFGETSNNFAQRASNYNRNFQYNNRRYFGSDQRYFKNNQGYFRGNHRNTGPYNRPNFRVRDSFERFAHNREQHRNVDESYIAPSPFEIKIENLINAVKSRSELSAKLVFMRNSHEVENPVTLLENAVNTTNLSLKVAFNETTKTYDLNIGNEKLAETSNCLAKQILKNKLCEIALDSLKKICFYIIKKKNYEEVSSGIQKNNVCVS